MNRLGLLLALAGLALAGWLIAQQDLSAVAALLGSAGAGLLLVVLAHPLCMAPNGWAWGLAMPRHQRPGLGTMTALVWIKQSVNTLLPVGRVGGEFAAWRLLRARGVGAAPAAGGMLLDMGVAVVAQLAFAWLGLALLLYEGHAPGWGLAIGGTLGGLVLAAPFIAMQNAGVFARVAGWLARVTGGRLAGLGADAGRLDRYLRAAWRNRRLVAWNFAWQMAANIAGALQIWIALWLLGAPVSFLEAVAIEALVQFISAFAFAIPAGLGVVEGAFVVVGALAGLDAMTSVALALTRRFRELVVYLPGLLAWAWAERRIARG
ncbi:MAG: lysylphosphatidylglycerol synthase domain-containing protein [Rubritepida sp.]|nr:lysylphosphatidylglycerol synthase domain-containing protein [Rubritepida sp.]